MRNISRRWLLTAAVLILLPLAALHGLIKNPYPLKMLITDAKFIVEAKVIQLDGEKKRLVIEVVKDLKGKLPFRRLNVNLASGKGDEPEKMLRRLRQGLPLAIFALRDDKEFTFIGFSEGTWFSMKSRTPPPKEEVKPDGAAPTAVCAFGTCEIYLRRTFAGSTKDLLSLLPDAIARKREAPAWNEKEPPGLGPELPAEK